MCLETVKDRMDKPTTLIQSGWKTFDGTQAQPRFENFAFCGSRDVPLDKWITAEVKKIKIGMLRKEYDAGFHIFEDETELERKTKRRVYYRRAHTRGRQDGATVVIAEELYVPSDPDGWPPQ